MEGWSGGYNCPGLDGPGWPVLVRSQKVSKTGPVCTWVKNHLWSPGFLHRGMQCQTIIGVSCIENTLKDCHKMAANWQHILQRTHTNVILLTVVPFRNQWMLSIIYGTDWLNKIQLNPPPQHADWGGEPICHSNRGRCRWHACALHNVLGGGRPAIRVAGLHPVSQLPLGFYSSSIPNSGQALAVCL